jgi:hypothetical protein
VAGVRLGSCLGPVEKFISVLVKYVERIEEQGTC